MAMNARDLRVAVAAIVAATTLSFARSSQGQDTEKALHDANNPIATTISVPFQNNSYFSAGPLEKTTNVLIVQPVIPLARIAKWNLISRWVARVVYVPRRSPDQGSEFGLGNLQPEFYFSAARTGKVNCGLGSRLDLPTETHDALRRNGVGGGP